MDLLEVCGSVRIKNIHLLIRIVGSHESYVRAILAPAVSPKSGGGLGFRAVVVNFRGCKGAYPYHVTCHQMLRCATGAGVPITSPQLYSAGHTEDYRAAILYVRARYPKAPLLGIGFSLGANVITRYVAEEGDGCRLVSAVALGCVRTCYCVPWLAFTYTDTAMGPAPKCIVVRISSPFLVRHSRRA